jgi:L-alanine-DL-glutamate epimerase-like enolase superfamily enzyme
MIIVDVETSAGVTGSAYIAPYRATPILAEPIVPVNGQITAPDRPGTGLVWDEAAIKKYAA